MNQIAGLALLFTLTLAGCGGGVEESSEPAPAPELDKLVVYTVNYPLAFFAERIGRDLADVRFPAPAGEDPAVWSPDAEIIAAYQNADLILVNGAAYAKWVERATLPASEIVDTSVGITDRLIELTGQVTHSHGPEGEHEHEGWAFTTWLDPELAGLQAEAVATAFISARPDHEADISARLESLRGELRLLDARIAATAAALGDAPLLFSHPVYQYLIARYDLNAEEIHWEPDVAPTGHDWDHLDELLAKHPARWMIWEGEPLDSSVAGLHERAIDSIVFDPCGNRPANGDFMTVMTANAEGLERITE